MSRNSFANQIISQIYIGIGHTIKCRKLSRFLTSLTLIFLVIGRLEIIHGAITVVNSQTPLSNKDSIIFDYKSSASIANKRIFPLYTRFKRTLSEKDQILSDECVKEIQSNQLEAAKEKLSHINDTTKIDYIVQKIYGQQKENFDRVLKFGDSIDDLNRRFLVYKALYYEMITIGHVETLPLILLTEHLTFKIMKHEDAKAEIKKEAILLFDAIEKTITDQSIQRITDSFLNKTTTLTTNEVIFGLPTTSFEYTYNVIRGVIDNIWQKLGIKKILSMVHETNNVKYVEYVIAFQKAIFNKIQSIDNTKNDLIELAIRMDELMDSQAYNSTPSSIKIHIEQVKENLPKSVKNIAFSSRVCIRNTQYNEYLYAADPSDDRYDLERRYVFTWLGGIKNDPIEPRKFIWKLERRKDGAFEIINDQYNEHLFAGDPKWDDDRRCALTWTPGGNCIDYSSWIFEPEGQFVYIKNNVENEYLFADYDGLYHQKRKVFTFVPKMKTPDSKWEIEDCSK